MQVRVAGKTIEGTAVAESVFRKRLCKRRLEGKAKRATEENRKAFEARRAELEKAQAATLAKAQERGAKLNGLTVQITQKAGPDGRLFGSVTNYDIVEALKKHGHEVERAQIRMPQGPLKQVGDYPLEIGLHTDVEAKITVSVLGEQ